MQDTTGLETLPAEVFSSITDFLTGPSLLSLSHTNRSLLTELLAPNSELWTKRVANWGPTSTVSAKQAYYTSRSICFPGNYPDTAETRRARDEQAKQARYASRFSSKAPDVHDTNARGGAVSLPHTIKEAFTEPSFSLGVDFALLPSSIDTPNVCSGGIVLGAQSVRWRRHDWANYHQQFIHIDPLGKLYCSMTDSKRTIALCLEKERWYSLVLSFERRDSSADEGTQNVYLDGELIDSSVGGLHKEWQNLHYMQIGSGCISGGAMGEPSKGYCGWYGFCGVVDEFTVWDRALSLQELQALKNGADKPPGVKWSLQQADASAFGNVKRVRCSRPKERRCVDVSTGVTVHSPVHDGSSDEETSDDD